MLLFGNILDECFNVGVFWPLRSRSCAQCCELHNNNMLEGSEPGSQLLADVQHTGEFSDVTPSQPKNNTRR